jgi:Ca2+-transporting ATPase
VTSTSVTVDPGLTTAEATRRLLRHGPNTLPQAPGPSWARRLVRSLRDPLVLVLLAALALTLLTGDLTDAAVIALVVVVNSAIGLRQELRADRAVRALGQMVATRAWVRREGQVREVPLSELVVGDLVLLRAGDLVPADAVLVEGSGLEVDESALTGESVPVGKTSGPDPGPDPAQGSHPGPRGGGQGSGDDVPPALVLSGTVVARGRGAARVVATGAESAVGRIASLLGSGSTVTPLQRRMARLSGQLAVAVVALSLVVMGVGLARGQSLELMAITAIALVVAAVPESLPLVVTVSLALAARRMARRHAVVRSLAAVETLGSVTLLATDKTGTLTEGSMTVVASWLAPDVSEPELLTALALCNDASRDEAAGRSHGDPTESALLEAALAGGVDVSRVRDSWPRVAETPFDSSRKMMSTIHRDGHAGLFTIHKGAPEAILRVDLLVGPPDVVTDAQGRAARWARRGIRVIAVAAEGSPEAPPAATTALGKNAVEPTVTGRQARLLGLVGLEDPVRDTSRATIAACREAGVQVVLVTGDHPSTAAAIAHQVGIGDGEEPVSLAGAGDGDRVASSGAQGAAVVARATPADKHSLVTAFQRAGHVVAMTGDGVNDGPALRHADIGVAMGRRGTEVARQAADLVLTDDNLGTVVAAIEEGRRVWDNIRRFLLYGLSGGASEILLMLVGPVVGIALPLLPAQILWLNLLTHSFAGAGLAGQPADPSALRRGPRPPHEGPLARGLWWRTAATALVLTAAAVAAMLAAPEPQRQTAALLALGVGQLSVAWALRTPGRRDDRWRGALLPLLAVASTMLAAATLLPPLRELLGTEVATTQTWLGALAAGVLAYGATTAMRGHRV